MTGGRGKQRNADLELTARAEVRELRFEKVPETETRFQGNLPRRISGSQRRNLPDEVQRGVEYHEAAIEWRASGWIGEKSTEGGVKGPDRRHVDS